MPVNLQSLARVQNHKKNSSQSVHRSAEVKQAVAGSLLSANSMQNLARPVLTNQEAEELGIEMESLGVEFHAAKKCRLWPDLQLFKGTREF